MGEIYVELNSDKIITDKNRINTGHVVRCVRERRSLESPSHDKEEFTKYRKYLTTVFGGF